MSASQFPSVPFYLPLPILYVQICVCPDLLCSPEDLRHSTTSRATPMRDCAS